MKIFVDVGSYIGDTLDQALKYDYDIIHCFEPVPEHFTNLIRRVSLMLYGPTIYIHPYGLLDKDSTQVLYAPGSDGASIYSAKKQYSHKNESIECTFRDVAPIFRQFHSGSEIDVKINCEGAEWAIISRLILIGRLSCINNLCIHVDVLKVPGMEHLAMEMESKLKKHYDGNRLMIGRNKQIYSDYSVNLGQDKEWVKNWLKHING